MFSSCGQQCPENLGSLLLKGYGCYQILNRASRSQLPGASVNLCELTLHGHGATFPKMGEIRGDETHFIGSSN